MTSQPTVMVEIIEDEEYEVTRGFDFGDFGITFSYGYEDGWGQSRTRFKTYVSTSYHTSFQEWLKRVRYKDFDDRGFSFHKRMVPVEIINEIRQVLTDLEHSRVSKRERNQVIGETLSKFYKYL